MNKAVAISIKTYRRPESLGLCVQSIEKFCDVPYRLHIADDSPPDVRPTELYDALRREGHHVLLYDRQIAVTQARNDTVKQLEDEEYLLRLDDDFRFTEETKVSVMLKIIQNCPQMGAISDMERQRGDGKGVEDGEVSRWQGMLLKHNNCFYRINIPVDKWTWLYCGRHRYAVADFTRNFLLIRRAVFDSVSWTEDLIFRGEHESFMVDIRHAGWQVAFTPDSVHVHDETISERVEYGEIPKSELGLKEMERIFLKKYGVKSIFSINMDKFLPHTKRSSKIRRIGRELLRLKKKLFH